MRITLNIAANELKKIFFSPIAWVMLLLMMVTAGDYFIGSFFDQELMSIALYNNQSVTSFITHNYISSPFGMVNKLSQVLYLFIPLLTMGVVSREYSSGTIKLLFSSGTTDSQIITGKFLGVCAYLFFAITLALLPVVTVLGMGIESIDMGLVLTALAGLYLMMCAYAAVGVFLSSLTSYQIVAAILSFIVLNLLSYGFHFETENQTANKLLLWFRLPRHLERMTQGMIVSEDIFYYLTIIFMFLGLAALRLRFRRKRTAIYKRIAGYIALIASCAVLGIATSEPRFMLYHDSTETKFNTLTEASKEIISHVDDQLVITGYSNLLDERFPFTSAMLYQRTFQTFEQYLRYLPRTRFEFVQFYDSIPGFDQIMPRYWREKFEGMNLRQAVDVITKEFGINAKKVLGPEEIALRIDLSAEDNLSLFEIENRRTGARRILRIFEDNIIMPTEKEISTAIKLLYTPAKKISMLTGHGERSVYGLSEQDYGSYTTPLRVRASLVNSGYEIDTLSSFGPKDIAGTDILWIADPREKLTGEQLQNINEYLEGGGNMLLAVRPERASLLKDIVEPLGVSFTQNLLVQQHSLPLESSVLISRLTQHAIGNPGLSRFYKPGYSVFAPYTTAINFQEYKDFMVIPFVLGDNGTWVELESQDFSHYDMPVYNADAGEYYYNNAPLIVGLEREVNGKTQRILVSGTADAFSNVEMRKSRPTPPFPQSANAGVFFGLLTWLCDGEFSLTIERPVGSDNSYTMAIEDRTWANPLLKFILPGLVAVIGLLVIMKRKGR